MMRELTDIERELLSTYRDREASPEEMNEAEALLASSPEARAWLEQVDRVGRLNELAARGAAARVGAMTSVNGKTVAQIASRGFFYSKAPFVGTLLLLLLLGGFLLVDSSRVEKGSRALRVQTNDRSPSRDLDLTPGQFHGGVANVGREVASLITPTDPEPRPVRVASPSRTEPSSTLLNAGSSTATTETSEPTPEPIDTAEALRPLQLSITLSHSSADVVLSDDQWSDTISLSVTTDRVVDLSARLSALTDTLNADVARIASDTARSSRSRAGLILIRQLEYEKQVAREIRELRELIEREEAKAHDPDQLEGAWLGDPKVSGIS